MCLLCVIWVLLCFPKVQKTTQTFLSGVFLKIPCFAYRLLIFKLFLLKRHEILLFCFESLGNLWNCLLLCFFSGLDLSILLGLESLSVFMCLTKFTFVVMCQVWQTRKQLPFNLRAKINLCCLLQARPRNRTSLQLCFTSPSWKRSSAGWQKQWQTRYFYMSYGNLTYFISSEMYLVMPPN